MKETMLAALWFFICILLCTISSVQVYSQETVQEVAQVEQNPFEKYREGNLGIALLGETWLFDNSAAFPGFSALIGRRFYKAGKPFFVEAEIGAAFPSLATAKFGAGIMHRESGKSIALGYRLWPSHLYVQFGGWRIGKKNESTSNQTVIFFTSEVSQWSLHLWANPDVQTWQGSQERDWSMNSKGVFSVSIRTYVNQRRELKEVFSIKRWKPWWNFKDRGFFFW